MVFSDTFFTVAMTVLHFRQGSPLGIQWEQCAEISSPIHSPSAGHFQLRDTGPIPSFLTYFRNWMNSCCPEERAHRLQTQKWSPGGSSQSNPVYCRLNYEMQSENCLSLSLRQQDFVSWKEIEFSLWKLVIDGSKFTQMCLFREILAPSVFPTFSEV